MVNRYGVVTEALKAPSVRKLDLREDADTGRAHCADCGNRWSTYKKSPDDVVKCPKCKSTDVEFGVNEEADGPKPPSEAQRVQTNQKREKLDTERRQNAELLAAKERDLQAQARKQSQSKN